LEIVPTPLRDIIRKQHPATTSNTPRLSHTKQTSPAVSVTPSSGNRPASGSPLPHRPNIPLASRVRAFSVASESPTMEPTLVGGGAGTNPNRGGGPALESQNTSPDELARAPVKDYPSLTILAKKVREIRETIEADKLQAPLRPESARSHQDSVAKFFRDPDLESYLEELNQRHRFISRKSNTGRSNNPLELHDGAATDSETVSSATRSIRSRRTRKNSASGKSARSLFSSPQPTHSADSGRASPSVASSVSLLGGGRPQSQVGYLPKHHSADKGGGDSASKHNAPLSPVSPNVDASTGQQRGPSSNARDAPPQGKQSQTRRPHFEWDDMEEFRGKPPNMKKAFTILNDRDNRSIEMSDPLENSRVMSQFKDTHAVPRSKVSDALDAISSQAKAGTKTTKGVLDDQKIYRPLSPGPDILAEYEQLKGGGAGCDVYNHHSRQDSPAISRSSLNSEARAVLERTGWYDRDERPATSSSDSNSDSSSKNSSPSHSRLHSFVSADADAAPRRSMTELDIVLNRTSGIDVTNRASVKLSSRREGPLDRGRKPQYKYRSNNRPGSGQDGAGNDGETELDLVLRRTGGLSAGYGRPENSATAAMQEPLSTAATPSRMRRHTLKTGDGGTAGGSSDSNNDSDELTTVLRRTGGLSTNYHPGQKQASPRMSNNPHGRQQDEHELRGGSGAVDKGENELDLVLRRTANLDVPSRHTSDSDSELRHSIKARAYGGGRRGGSTPDQDLRGGSGAGAQEEDTELDLVLRRTAGISFASSQDLTVPSAKEEVRSALPHVRQERKVREEHDHSRYHQPKDANAVADESELAMVMRMTRDYSPSVASLAAGPAINDQHYHYSQPQQQQQQQYRPPPPPSPPRQRPKSPSEDSDPNCGIPKPPMPVFGRFPSPPAHIIARAKNAQAEDEGQGQPPPSSPPLPPTQRRQQQQYQQHNSNPPRVIEEDEVTIRGGGISHEAIVTDDSRVATRTSIYSDVTNNPRPTIQPCHVCRKDIYPIDKLTPHNIPVHRKCLRCETCNGQLTMTTYRCIDGHFYCEPHFKQYFPGDMDTCKPRKSAASPLSRRPARTRASTIFERNCNNSGGRMSATKPDDLCRNETVNINGWNQPLCPVCEKVVYVKDRITFEHYHYHQSCFRCHKCSRLLGSTNAAVRVRGHPYCMQHGTSLLRRRSNLMHRSTRRNQRSRQTSQREGEGGEEQLVADAVGALRSFVKATNNQIDWHNSAGAERAPPQSSTNGRANNHWSETRPIPEKHLMSFVEIETLPSRASSSSSDSKGPSDKATPRNYQPAQSASSVQFLTPRGPSLAENLNQGFQESKVSVSSRFDPFSDEIGANSRVFGGGSPWNRFGKEPPPGFNGSFQSIESNTPPPSYKLYSPFMAMDRELQNLEKKFMQTKQLGKPWMRPDSLFKR
ncbi:hypothetical protein EV182_001282, partial [Spiromyces aspiralis]